MAMENLYRIKEEYKDLVLTKWDNETFVKCDKGYRHRLGTMVFPFLDEMFEKVEEERITVTSCYSKFEDQTILYIKGKLSDDKVDLCEKAINGELVEKDKIKKAIEGVRKMVLPSLESGGDSNNDITHKAIGLIETALLKDKEWIGDTTITTTTTEVPISDRGSESITFKDHPSVKYPPNIQ